MRLEQILERVPNSLLAAWIDSRNGTTLEKLVAGSSGLAGVGASVSAGLDAVTEIVCSPDRPRRMVLMSAREVYIAQRPAADSHRVLIVVCQRTPNVGIAVVLVGMCASEGGA
jgi:hypothetical protein